MTERRLHLDVAQFLDLALPVNAEWHHSPLQGQGRGQKNGAILHAMGARAGWPDIQIVYNGRAHFIELKGPRGSLNSAQKERLESLHAITGGRTAVCKSVEEVAGTLKGWGVPIRAEVEA